MYSAERTIPWVRRSRGGCHREGGRPVRGQQNHRDVKPTNPVPPISPFGPHDKLAVGGGLVDTLSHHFHFTDEKTEAQRDGVPNRNP